MNKNPLDNILHNRLRGLIADGYEYVFISNSFRVKPPGFLYKLRHRLNGRIILIKYDGERIQQWTDHKLVYDTLLQH